MKGLVSWIPISLLAAVCLAGCSASPHLTSSAPRPPAQPSPPSLQEPTALPLPPTPTRWVYRSSTPRPTRTPIPSKTPSPTPPPLPPFTGRLLLELEDELYWLTGTGGEATLSEPLASQVRERAVSPDGRYLVYSGIEDNITLMDLTTGKKQAVAASTALCYRWSPQSARFTYKVSKPSPGLYMYDVASKTSVRITDFPCASYSGPGLGGAAGGQWGTGTFCGEVTCGAWMDEAHLLFQRFTGPMPATITRTVAGLTPIGLRAQLTTMATFGKAAGQRPKLADWPERVYEVERCNSGPYILLRQEVEGESVLSISPVFTDTAAVQLRPAPKCKYAAECSGAPYFADVQCNLLIGHSSMGGLGGDYVVLVDPVNLEEVLRSAQLPTRFTGQDGKQVHAIWSWRGERVWVGDPEERILALAVSGPKNTQVMLVDLHTGGKLVLLDHEAINSDVLAWLAP